MRDRYMRKDSASVIKSFFPGIAENPSDLSLGSVLFHEPLQGITLLNGPGQPSAY